MEAFPDLHFMGLTIWYQFIVLKGLGVGGEKSVSSGVIRKAVSRVVCRQSGGGDAAGSLKTIGIS